MSGAALDSGNFFRRQDGLKLPGNFLGNGTDDGKKVVEFAGVALCPEVSSGFTFNQLDRYPNLVAGSLDGTLQQIFHAQLTSDLFQRFDRVAVLKSRCASYDQQFPDLRQVRQNLFVHPVGKEGILQIGAHVGEWEDGDGFAQVFDLEPIRRAQGRGRSAYTLIRRDRGVGPEVKEDGQGAEDQSGHGSSE